MNNLLSGGAPGCPSAEPEVILLVDDEELVLDSEAAMLRRLGYRVHTALDGETAVEMYEQIGRTVDAVLLDLSLPGMDGRMCLSKLRELDPGLRCMISSGLTT